MKNLFLNLIRSLKKNKLSILGLTFLVFISTGIYTVLNSSTTAINNEYQRISTTGVLHDFTVAEYYNTGVAKYSNNVSDHKINDVNSFNSSLYNNCYLVKSNDGVILPYIEIVQNNNKYNLTIHYELDTNVIEPNTSLRLFFESIAYNTKTKAYDYNSSLWDTYHDLLAPTYTYNNINLSNELAQYFGTDQKQYGKNNENNITNKTSDEILNLIQSVLTSVDINTSIEKTSNELYTVASTEATPMDNYLNDKIDGQGNNVTFRTFYSLDINNSSNIFYKVVKSESNDKIDKMVHINLKNRSNETQWDNFAVSDCTYDVLDYVSNDNYDIGKTLRYLPILQLTKDKYDIHYIEKIFLLSKGIFSDGASQKNTVLSLTKWDNSTKTYCPKTEEERQAYWTEKYTALENFRKNEISNFEVTNVKPYTYTIQWTSALGTPSTFQLSNWTSYFANVNPEYMQLNNKSTMSSSLYENEESYKEYISNNPDLVTQKQKFLGWLNSLDFPKIDEWFKKITIIEADKYSQYFINPGSTPDMSGCPFIIIGSGITPDFIYPIVSISRSTPDPKSECIFFSNNAGYHRIFDSFRENQSENYIVGKFNTKNNVIRKQILDQINEKARTMMTLPKGINAAYFANDTSNTLNASAFRIAYIPKFIHAINSISISLTIFIIVVCLIICAIIIHRYVVNIQTILGLMRANGVSSLAISTSLLPFSFIPVFFGGIIGIIIGNFLQTPVLNLYKSYWMLPTATLGINWISLIAIILIILFFFSLVIYVTSWWVLRKNTVDLMKANSNDNPKYLSRFAKRRFSQFNIITKFRVAVAFSSVWKLFVLALMTSISLSSLLFILSIQGKFGTSISATANNRNYSYAIDLCTPTIEGGQYIPVNYDLDKSDDQIFNYVGASGFNRAGNDYRDNNYLQSLYYGSQDEISGIYGAAQYTFNVPGIEYDNFINKIPIHDDLEININDLNHKYYVTTWFWDANYNKGIKDNQDFEDYIKLYSDSFLQNGHYFSNIFIPYLGDSLGENADIFYSKNRYLTKSMLDYQVGAMGIVSNPWDIASSLMPENNRNLCLQATNEFADFIGNAIYYEEGVSNIVYKKLHDKLASTKSILSTDDDHPVYLDDVGKTFVPEKKDNDHYMFDKSKCIPNGMGLCLKPEFIQLLISAYSFQQTAQIDYYITYSTIPLESADETYTYLSTNVVGIRGHNLKSSAVTSTKVYGIKVKHGNGSDNSFDSKYVNLLDDKNNKLYSKIACTTTSGVYPIVINKYAQHLYGLHIGDKITMKINNKADRIRHQIILDNNNGIDNDWNDTYTFEITGIVNTYVNQEYYIDQDLANYILNLKTHLLDNQQNKQNDVEPHSYYCYEKDTISDWKDFGVFGGRDKEGLQTKATYVDLKNYSNSRYVQNGNLTPYGFNGVFTKNKDSNPLLTKGVILYSPSGLYPANDQFTSDASRNIFSYGSNAYLSSIVALDGNETNIPICNTIKEAYNEFISDRTAINHNKLTNQVGDLINQIRKYYGEQPYMLVVASVDDKLSFENVYRTMSETITQISYSLITVVLVMIAIIIALISNLIINDSRRLASILKSLGYTDRENAMSFSSIYIPVIIIGIGVSALLTWGLISIYNAFIFNSMSIWLNASIKWYHYFIGLGVIIPIFGLSILSAVISLKKGRLVDDIK